MKVLQVNAIYEKKSTGKIVEAISLMLENEGHEAYIAGPFSLNKKRAGCQIGNKIDWKVHALLTRITGKQGFFSHFSTKRFLKYLDNIKPDIIHLHNIHANFINLPLLLRYIREKRIGLVLTLHDCWYFTGKCFHFADIDCDKYQMGCVGCPKKRQEIPSLFKDNAYWVYRNKKNLFLNIPNKKIVGCSKWIAGVAQESFFDAKDITYIYNGVNTRIFKSQDRVKIREEKGIKQEFVILGMANKWELLENENAVKTLFEHYAALDSIFLIIGCTAEAKKRFNNLSSHYGTKIMLVDYIHSSEELAKYYACSDVFVNLTHIDTLPTVNMESICCGTPIVTYNSGGSPELVLKDCGFVVDNGDICSLIKAIEYSRGLDRVRIANIGEKSFNEQSNFKKYLAVYQSIIDEMR